MPVAQSTNYSLEPHSSDDDSAPDLAHISLNNGSQAAIWQDAQFDNPDILAANNPTHSQAQADVHNAVDTNNNTDDKGSFCDPSTSTSTSPRVIIRPWQRAGYH